MFQRQSHKKDKFAHLAGGKQNPYLLRQQKSSRRMNLDKTLKNENEQGLSGAGKPKRKPRFVQRKSTVWSMDCKTQNLMKRPLSTRRPSTCSHDLEDTSAKRTSML